MALTHFGSGQPIDIAPLGERLADAMTTALFKASDLEVMRVVLMTGQSLRPHKVAGDVTVQCIEGELDVSIDGESRVLHAGQMVLIARDVMHGLRAVADASALVTIALRK